jgi:hypothetical protein
VLLFAPAPRVFAEESPPVAAAPATQVEITVVGRASEFRFARSLVGAGSPGMASARCMRTERYDVSVNDDVLTAFSPWGMRPGLALAAVFG